MKVLKLLKKVIPGSKKKLLPAHTASAIFGPTKQEASSFSKETKTQKSPKKPKFNIGNISNLHEKHLSSGGTSVPKISPSVNTAIQRIHEILKTAPPASSKNKETPKSFHEQIAKHLMASKQQSSGKSNTDISKALKEMKEKIKNTKYELKHKND